MSFPFRTFVETKVKVMANMRDKLEFKIKAPRQDNGLFGMPLQCTSLDVPRGEIMEKYEELFSAICNGIAEKFPEETFQVMFWTDDSFMVKLSKSGYRKIWLDYYRLEGNTLIWEWDL